MAGGGEGRGREEGIMWMSDTRALQYRIQREILVRHLFHVQNLSQSLLFIDSRLANRETVVDFDGQLMGPIMDEQGLEQGGISSSDLYKIYGKEQLSLAQHSLCMLFNRMSRCYRHAVTGKVTA